MINLDHLLNIPSEDWRKHGVITSAVSTNSDGLVNSFIGTISKGRKSKGKKVYGYRKQEFLNGVFTDNQKFVIEDF